MRSGTFARKSSSWTLLFALLLSTTAARAGRPFVTDDAGVVGKATLQLESWGHFHSNAGEHFTTLALGPIDELEVAVAGMWALSDPDAAADLSVAGPTVQFKLLGRGPDAGGLPGVAGAVGFTPPVGTGPLAPVDPSLYMYLAFTESPLASDVLSFHLNLGLVGNFATGRYERGPSWAIAAGYGLVDELVVFVEAFSSDPLVEPTAGAGHGGISYGLSEFVSFDATAGTRLWGASSTEPFVSIGMKLVSAPLW